MQGRLALLAALCLSVSSAWAQTPDQIPSNAETACETASLRGGALGLCRAWGEALDCERKEAMLGTSHRQRQACAQLETNFRRASGGRDLTHLFGVAIIPSEGGSATLENVASATFPAGAFSQKTYVRVTQTKSEDLDALFRDTAAIYAPLPTTGEQIHINTDMLPPISDSVMVQVRVPDGLLASTPPGYAVRLFAQVRQGSADHSYDGFEIFPSVYDPATRTLTTHLPTAVFSDGRTAGSEQEAVLVLAPVRVSWQQEASSLELQPAPTEDPDTCTTRLICPVVGGCILRSEFQGARRHPVTGEVRPHFGVDYKAPVGTPIVAAAAGKVERAYSSGTFGETIIIRHTDGSATLSAHLSRIDVREGNVSAGQVIGLSGNTGLSQGPHLHFEYVPYGNIIQSPRRIDPERCREEQCKELSTEILTHLRLTTGARYSQFATPQGSDYIGTTPNTISSSATGQCGPDSAVSGNSSAAPYAVSASSKAQNCGINVPGASASTTATLDFSRCTQGVTGPISGKLTLQLDTQLLTINFPGIWRQATTSVHGSFTVSYPGGYVSQSGSADLMNGPYRYQWSNYGFMSGMPEHGGSKTITVPITLKPGQYSGTQVRVSASVSSSGLSLEPAADSSASLRLSGVSLLDATGKEISTQCVCAK